MTRFCNTCLTSIEASAYILLDTISFHVDHFLCYECREPLEFDNHAYVDGNIYCCHHYDPSEYKDTKTPIFVDGSAHIEQSLPTNSARHHHRLVVSHVATSFIIYHVRQNCCQSTLRSGTHFPKNTLLLCTYLVHPSSPQPPALPIINIWKLFGGELSYALLR